jgi:16S rRNA G966 N2-methylase RsmD
VFYYYGAKRRLARYYPAPEHSTIVEPFAGSAGYSMFWALKRPELRIVLIEKDPRTAAVWTQLLGLTPEQIEAYPVPAIGERTADRFVMFAMASNATATCSSLTVTARVHQEATRMRRGAAQLRRFLDGRVTVVCGDYTEAPDIEATWFVDPPYQAQERAAKTANPGGRGYGPGCRNADIDFDALASWCRARRGQVIACENAGADWLPFRHLRDQTNTVGRPTREVVWTSAPDRQAALGGGSW